MKSDKKEELLKRMAVVREKLIKPFMPIYEYEFGEQKEKRKTRIRNVYSLRIMDEKIISNFEKLIK